MKGTTHFTVTYVQNKAILVMYKMDTSKCTVTPLESFVKPVVWESASPGIRMFNSISGFFLNYICIMK